MKKILLIIFLLFAKGFYCLAQVGINTYTPWEFIKGDSSVPGNTAVYGFKGAVAIGNKPGARTGSITWKDASGKFWLFGGYGSGANNSGFLNDLWKYDPLTDQWTFMKGDNITRAGNYGVRGVASDENKPGGRRLGVSWIDASGNLWMFGGQGLYSSEASGFLNDLWKYSPASNQWTWVSGDNAIDVFGVYGSQGISAINNKPGGRWTAFSWVDNAGNFWLFGGQGHGSTTRGYLNDLWKFNPLTSEWTWVKGDSTQSLGFYGTQGIPGPNNRPGSRMAGGAWTDNSGNLWLFGGGANGYSLFYLKNDLWRYDISTNQWTWMKGDSTQLNHVYGTQGVFSPNNKPGVRVSSTSWTDNAGNFWLFGGNRVTSGFFNDLWKYDPQINQWAWMKGDTISESQGLYGPIGSSSSLTRPPSRIMASGSLDASGNLLLFGGGNFSGDYNDLWRFNISNNQWSWIKGDSTFNNSGIYGEATLASEGNNPGPREGSVTWRDASGNLWLFGGDSDTTSGVNGFKNDLWKYNSSSNQWIWMKGDSTRDSFGNYGAIGVTAATNNPGARFESVSWTDASGNLWLYGGFGYDQSTTGFLNDLWKYDPSTNNWTWMKGNNTVNVTGVYGSLGVSSPTNKPGARYSSISWIDGSGKLWLFGGYGFPTANNSGHLNDLWRYDIATNNWTWIKGDDAINSFGNYGLLGIQSASNKPGGRYYSNSWADASGNLWLFGGYGYHVSAINFLNDLWKYNIVANEWIWMKGDNSGGNNGIYGTFQTESVSNKPGARYAHHSWKDNAGNFWLFGGTGYAESGGGNLNDLWKYNPASNNWTWMKGDKSINQLANFGTRELEMTSTKPGASKNGVTITDNNGNLLLFGGLGNTSNGESLLSLLFRFNTTTNNWTWLKGVKSASHQGIFGLQGTASNINKPGARSGSVSWIDTSNALWLFGGMDHRDYLNDLWKLDAATKQWTWIKGDSNKNVFAGAYGILEVPAAANFPGARKGSVSWRDKNGKLWIFGGLYVQNGTSNYLNDLWKYDPVTNHWVWMKGNNTPNINGVYGTINNGSQSNVPGAREGSLSWTDTLGIMWLYGGFGYAANGVPGYLNDLWKYNSLTNTWTWVKGDNFINAQGLYGFKGVSSNSNKPGGRKYSVAWIDTTGAGNLWLFGGVGYVASGSPGYLSDFWKYDPLLNQWTWVEGNTTTNRPGVYSGTTNPGAREGAVGWNDIYGQMWLHGGLGYDENGNLGVLNDFWKYEHWSQQWVHVKGQHIINAFGSAVDPGARRNAVPWLDRYGDLWLFGGYGKGTSGTGYLNDLWKIFGGIKFIFNRTGDWNTPSNWVGGVVAPTIISQGINVIINHEIPGVCINQGTIVLKTDGRLKVESGKMLTINQGGLANAGFVIGPGNQPGKVLFTGSNTDSLISTGSLTTPILLQDKKMYLTGNTSTSTVNLLGGATSRDNSTNSVGSSLSLGDFNLLMDTAALVTNNTNYIITNGTGRLIRRVDNSSTVLFPIGIDESSYTPVTITNNGNTDDFKVGVRNGVYSRADSGTAITTGNVNRTWVIEKNLSTDNNANVSLQWNLAEEQVQFLRAGSYISHFQSCPPPDPCVIGYWDEGPISPASVSGTSYLQTRNIIEAFNSYPYFTVSSRVEYIFVNAMGDGNWSNINNWMYQRKPPVDLNNPNLTIIGQGMHVTISQNCLFTGELRINQGGNITVAEGKRLTLLN